MSRKIATLIGAGIIGGATGFQPSQIANLKQWLDFSDISPLFQDDAGTTPVTADGQAIGRASDKSGQANHATQATPTAVWKANIQNSKGMALFNGTSSLLVTTYGADIAQPYSMFAVVKPVVVSANHIIGGRIDTSTNTSSGVIAPNATPNWITYSGATIEDGVVTTAPHIITVIFNGASSTLRVNGVETTGDAGTRVLRQLGFGGNARGALFNNCYIGEFGLYTSAFTAGNISSIETYLRTKWNINP